MRVIINRESNIPVYIQIFEQIRQQIISGEFTPGFRLPPERKLAETLGVNRTTVLNAYYELKAEGLIDSHVGKGTIVLGNIDEALNPSEYSKQDPVWNHIFSQYSNQFDSVIVRDLLKLASRKDVISFATGIASPEMGPINVLSGIEKELIENRNYKALLHSPTEGFSSFRDAVQKLMNIRGTFCQRDEVMILSGSQQGIDLAARVLIDPGDIVVVEEPSFFPAIQAFKASGARIIGIPLDEKGMRLDLLEQLLQRYRPKLIYTMPTFQNPTGIEMELDRRKNLLELAYKYRVLIIEDDAYGDLCYEGHLLPTLKALDKNNHVIYLSTFSKNVYPGLRLGWMVAHKKVVNKFSVLKQIMDLHSNTLSQWIVERFLTSRAFDEHVVKICKEYKVRRDIMYDSLLKYAPAGMKWSRPKGGYYIWCRLPEGVSATRLVSKAADYEVVFVPGTAFFTSGQGDEFIRLNFTFASAGEIDEGIKRLCLAIKELNQFKDEYEIYTDIEINPIV